MKKREGYPSLSLRAEERGVAIYRVIASRGTRRGNLLQALTIIFHLIARKSAEIGQIAQFP